MIDERFFRSNGPLSISDLIKGLPVKTGSSFDLSAPVSSAAALTQSRPGDVTYLAGRRYVKTLEQGSATACFTAPPFEDDVRAAGMIPLVTDNPRTQFAYVLDRLFTVIEAGVMTTSVHPSANVPPCVTLMPGAVIAQNAQIGKRTRLGVGAYIGPGVIIGDDCNIGPNVAITCAIVGNKAIIGASSVIGQRGFGVTKDGKANVDIPHLGRVIIGNNVTMGGHSAFDRGMLADTVIGDGCKFDNFCQIAHNVQIGKNGIFAGFVGLSGSCIIGDDVVMGGQSGLAEHLIIGDGAQIAGNAGVMKDVPAGEVWSGYPAMPIRKHMKEVATLSRLANPKKKL